MAYLFIQLFICSILCWYGIDGVVLNCTVYPVMLQLVPDQIVGTIAVANSSNEEIFWGYVDFQQGAQFPLTFTTTIYNQLFIADIYILQLHIYKVPRAPYDLPLWSAESTNPLTRAERPNSIIFYAFSDYKPLGPCLMGVILKAQHSEYSLTNTQLTVQVGSTPTIVLSIHQFMSSFPLLFMVTDIPLSESQNSTLVKILISGGSTIRALEARATTLFSTASQCAMAIFRASEERWMNLTLTMSAHVLTTIPLLSLAAAYRIYLEDYLFYEQSETVDVFEFPFRTSNQLIPISMGGNYSIEATIFGPVAGFASGVTLFQGLTKTRLTPGIDNNVKISMLYTGPMIGTTIVGTIQQIPFNLYSWPLLGWNLAIAINNQANNVSEAAQFIIFDQTFPIEFTVLNTRTITGSNQNVIITVAITFFDATVIYEALNEYNRLLYGQLNKLNVNVSFADSYRCQTIGGGACVSASTTNINGMCCSQFKCSYGQCRLS